MNAYNDARVDGAKTLGDAYRHHDRDPEAFVAGVQYALDRLTGQAERWGIPLTPASLDLLATETLERAKRGEPQ